MTAKTKKRTRSAPPKFLFGLFDRLGAFRGTYPSREEAEDDAWGPDFYGAWRVRVYELVPVSAEVRR